MIETPKYSPEEERRQRRLARADQAYKAKFGGLPRIFQRDMTTDELIEKILDAVRTGQELPDEWVERESGEAQQQP